MYDVAVATVFQRRVSETGCWVALSAGNTSVGAARVDDVIVKFALEISKKMLPTASTFILAVVVGVLGMVTVSVPSLGVLATSVLKLLPPSVEMEIFTLAQLTGAAVVLATDHVIACDELPAHDTAVLGDDTWNGPEELLTVTVMSMNWV